LLDQWHDCSKLIHKDPDKHVELGALYKKVEASFTYESRIRSIASELINGMGGVGHFLGLHYRGNEFDQYDQNDSPHRLSQYFSRLAEVIKGDKSDLTLPPNMTIKLYVSTDKNSTWFGEKFPMMQGSSTLNIRGVFWSDFADQLQELQKRHQFSNEKWSKIVSFIETQVAASSGIFIGSEFSTFTENIVNMRGGMGMLQASQLSKPLYHLDTFSNGTICDAVSKLASVTVLAATKKP
jgi:hypothetical protein